MLYNMTKSEMFVSTHSRLKAAGTQKSDQIGRHGVSTHSRLKAAGSMVVILITVIFLFQHTAA